MRTWIESIIALQGINIADLSPHISLDAVGLPSGFHPDPAGRQILDYAAQGHLIAQDAQR